MFIEFLLLFTIINKIILSAIILFRKNNSLPSKIIGLIVLLPAFTFISVYFNYHHHGDLSMSPLIFINQILIHFMAPLIYFYCLLMMGRKVKLTGKNLLPFSTALIPAGCWVVYSFVFTVQQQQEFMLSIFGVTGAMLHVINRSIESQFIFMSALTLFTIVKHRKKARQFFSEEEKAKVNWLFEFVGLMLAIAFSIPVSEIFFDRHTVELIIVPILSNIFYFYILYSSLKNSVLFTHPAFTEFKGKVEVMYEPETEPAPSYSLSESQIEESGKATAAFLLQHKPYLNPELTLAELALMQNIPVHKLSAVINGYFNQNFFSLINTYRVNEAKQKMLKPDSELITLEALAEECGFGSKTTFNRAFKQVTGITPTQYKKETAKPAKELV